jgi:outer membrane lipoprotein-sorting protein
MNETLLGKRWTLFGFAAFVNVAIVCMTPPLLQANEEFDKKAAALLDKYVEVTGGTAAYDAIKNRVVKAEVSVAAIGMTAKMELFAAQPDKFYMRMDPPNGTVQRGWDGKVVWSIDPINGARILEGAEKVTALRDSTQDRFARWRKLFEKAEYVGEEAVGETTCAKIVLTPKPIDVDVKESPVQVFVDPQSGLIKKWSSEFPTPQGTVEAAILMGDYKKVGDIQLAHEMRVVVQGIEQKVTIESAKFNTEIPAGKFALPDEVKALLQDDK